MSSLALHKVLLVNVEHAADMMRVSACARQPGTLHCLHREAALETLCLAPDAPTNACCRWEAGKPLSVLDGVPYAVKDNIDAVPYPTTSGSAVLQNM